jgi:hypothetical protein
MLFYSPAPLLLLLFFIVIVAPHGPPVRCTPSIVHTLQHKCKEAAAAAAAAHLSHLLDFQEVLEAISQEDATY